MHGAYIEDYNKYIDNWRFTQVLFYRPIAELDYEVRYMRRNIYGKNY